MTHQAISAPSELVAACSSIGVTRWPLHRCQARNTTPAAVVNSTVPITAPEVPSAFVTAGPDPNDGSTCQSPNSPDDTSVARHQPPPTSAGRTPRKASSSSTTVPSGIRTERDEQHRGQRTAPRSSTKAVRVAGSATAAA